MVANTGQPFETTLIPSIQLFWPFFFFSMEDLPPPLLVEILTRLNDSTDLARCRLASKTLNSLSNEVHYVNLLCTFSRYLKSRSPETKAHVTSFKAIFNNLVREARCLNSISIGVDKSLRDIPYDDVDDESDDLYLTDVGFVKEWLPKVCGELRKLSISDFWIQSCWRKSEVLSFISSCCNGLIELELKNAWLSVDGLNPMTMVTSLTLEFIRLEDEDLNKVNDCFPSLRVLNLVRVGGLKDPKIHLLHLKSCLWIASNAPHSLTIFAPNLVKLRLKCIKPKSLVLDTPLLSDFHLSVEEAYDFRVKEFYNLENLQLESSSLPSLLGMFPSGKSIKKLTVDSLKWTEALERRKFGLEALFDVFPNVVSLNLGPGAWSEAEICFQKGGLDDRNAMKELTEIVAHLVVHDIEVTLSFIYSILDKCTNLSDMALLLQRKEDSRAAISLISNCTTYCPRVKWRWGMRKKGSEDVWVSVGI
ncbi:F-box/LRR-repeat protein At4g29420-like isoform X1 [Durio zibethinus]|uniref:F-box/LRR-repeat protein At4g29420-like isoform X1 n=1 Tax=Durio zibethinus TaxID=66656 RepID=A0A6P5XNH8_DURZI|nr:F-box/LRR-repeat protein At4g29420-like isoform X1 [Durio zibethinus]